jgi:hypothetical protein
MKTGYVPAGSRTTSAPRSALASWIAARNVQWPFAVAHWPLPGATSTPSSVVIIALLGATVTVGLFCWELRNIQTCDWLRDCAGVIEMQLGLARRPAPRRFLGIEIRKT